jgi:uncharacterized protein (DUF2164 family)
MSDVVNKIMTQVHVFASSYSLVGSPLATDNQYQESENEKQELKRLISELAKNDDRLKKLRRLMGYLQGATEATVKLYQDDATGDFIVNVGGKTYWGKSLNEALDKAEEDK